MLEMQSIFAESSMKKKQSLSRMYNVISEHLLFYRVKLNLLDLQYIKIGE